MRNLWLLVLLRGVALSSPIHAALVDGGRKHRPVAEPGSPEFWFHLTVSAVLVLLGGVFAGLTLGLMGLDDLHLRVLATSSEDPYEQRNAKQVLQLMSKGRHWILVVLLLCNVVINESLPIFLDSAIGGGIAAVAISTTAIVIFGFFPESAIIPQAVCVRYGLAIGAKCAPFVLALMWILSPIAYPIAKLLDWVLGGEEHNTYKKAELKSFLQFHRTGEEPLRDDEINILNGVLELNTKKVETIMTCIEDTVTLSSDTILDHAKVDSILSSGYSRFPVHTPEDPTAFIGLLLIKKLLTYDPAKALPVSAFPLSILPEAYPSINCFQALDYFQTGRAHLLLISRTPGQAGGAIGVITLEDIIEEIISEEIVDETDRYEDNQSKRSARRATSAAIMRGIVERQKRPDSIRSESSPLLLPSSRNYDSISVVPVLPKSALGRSPTNADP
ncbi:Protein MAM3 [Termitomyces sp. T112]|nr:Protein MAM3 [Termitomyces sp. T112]